jgi:hypothetical protein
MYQQQHVMVTADSMHRAAFLSRCFYVGWFDTLFGCCWIWLVLGYCR